MNEIIKNIILINQLLKLVKADLKRLQGKSKSSNRSISSNLLPKFLNIEDNLLITHSNFTKLIYQYIKKNNLLNKKMITPDKNIEQLLQLKNNDCISGRNVQPYIKQLILTIDR